MTYNWGSMEWAIANRVLPRAALHFEAGFGKEEADTQLRRRVLCRRWALARCTRIVVPSHRLEKLPTTAGELPAELVSYLPNGVYVGAFFRAGARSDPRFPAGPAN